MKKVILGVAVLAISGSVFSETYIGLNIHQSKLDTVFDDQDFEIINIDDEKSNGYEITIGHDINENISVEASYVDFGEWTIEDVYDPYNNDFSMNALTLGVINKYKMTPETSIYFKLGYYKSKSESEIYDYRYKENSITIKDSTSDVFYGIGVVLPLDSSSFDINIKYMAYPDSEGSTISTLSAGVARRF